MLLLFTKQSDDFFVLIRAGSPISEQYLPLVQVWHHNYVYWLYLSHINQWNILLPGRTGDTGMANISSEATRLRQNLHVAQFISPRYPQYQYI